MNCQHCGDKGIIRLCYHSGDPDDFGICLCAAGQAWRVGENCGRKTNPLWHVWAAIKGIAHERIVMIEDWAEPEDIARMFPAYRAAMSEPVDDVLLAAGRTRRGKL
jgi:hypothetical protein